MTTDELLGPVWAAARTSEGPQYWIEKLERLAVCDGITYAYKQLPSEFRQRPLEDYLRTHILLDSRPSILPDEFAMRTFVLTIERLADSLQNAMRTVFEIKDPRVIPDEGVLQYFSDDLSFCLYAAYTVQGHTIVFQHVVPILNPVLVADPRDLIGVVQSDADLDLLRRALQSRHKLVILRNTLIYVDRDSSPVVFGPSIDTLFISDWLLTNRYAGQRLNEDAGYFRDPVPRSYTDELLAGGVRVLEVGCGNGLISAVVARNEARLYELHAIDVSLAAIDCTYRNVFAQRRLHHGQWIGDRGTYTVGRFAPATCNGPFDLVISNPPYIPTLSTTDRTARYAMATHGTELLEQLVSGCSSVVGDGELYLIASNLARSAIADNLEPGYRQDVVARRKVPFQVEGVDLSSGSEQLEFLKRCGLTAKSRAGITRYEHEVRILRISAEREESTP